MTTPAHRSAVIAAFAAVYLIWGSTYVALRIGVESLPPFLLAGTRFVIAGAVLFAWSRRRSRERIELRHWRSATIIGALMLLGGNGVVTWAEQTVPAGIAALVITTVPLWMVMLESLAFGGQRPTAAIALGLALGFGGVVLLVGPGGWDGTIDPVGVMALLFAAFSWANGSLYSRRAALPRSAGLAPAMEMLGGGGLLLVLGLATGEANRFEPAAVSPASLAALVYLIVFGSIVGLSAYMYLLKVTSAAAASTYAFVNPIVAVLLGWAILGETLGWSALAAAILIIGAVVLITVAQSRRARARVALESPVPTFRGPVAGSSRPSRPRP